METGAWPLWRIHWGRTPSHSDMASTNHSLDGGVGVARSYDRKRAQKHSPGDRFFCIGCLRLAAATSASHAAD